VLGYHTDGEIKLYIKLDTKWSLLSKRGASYQDIPHYDNAADNARVFLPSAVACQLLWDIHGNYDAHGANSVTPHQHTK